MPITANDIKVLASARMVDAVDGGGQMTGIALQDGAENNVFPDISTVDRAAGAIALRKVFPAVLTLTADTLLDTHVVIDSTPSDPFTSGLLMASANSPQTVAGLTAALNAAGEAFGFYGTAAVPTSVASGAQTIPVSGLRAPLIPKSQLSEAVSGGLEDTGAQPKVEAWVPSGQTVAFQVLADTGNDLIVPSFFGKVAPGSISGTFTAPSGAGVVSSTPDGQITLTAPGFSALLSYRSDTLYPLLDGTTGLTALTDLAITAEALVRAQLPQRKLSVPPVAGRVVYEVSLPPGTAIASERLTVAGYAYTPTGLPPTATVNIAGSLGAGRETFVFSDPDNPLVASAYLSRATGLLTVLLRTPLPVGASLEVTYAEGGTTVPLAASELVSGGLFSGNTAQVTVGSGLELIGAAFNIAGGEAGLTLLGGIIRNLTGSVRGSASAAGVVNIPGNDGRTISGWHAAQFNPAYGVLSVNATLPVNIDPATLVVTGQTVLGVDFTATAAASGVFSTAHVTGTYDPATGVLALVFASSTKLRSLNYEGTRALPQTSFADLYGLDPSKFAEDGTVPIFRPGDLVVLRHAVTVAAATYANGNTVSVGRTDLADIRVRGANGIGISTGWTADLSTGVLTVNDISGWSQPVTITHSIEHVALVQALPNAGNVTLSRATTRAFPSGSVLCSALRLGDLQARAGAAFSQEAWTDVWSDVRIGSPVTAQYQQSANPIAVSNAGAITERWAFIFLTNTTFRLVGETLGVVAQGDVNSNFSPVNPATGQPYFTILAAGWGAWAAGNVLRLNTYGANAPVWAARVVLPSAPNPTPDYLTIAVRGDLDA